MAIKNDRFGNVFQNIQLKHKVSKSGYENFVGYIELSSKLYKIETQAQTTDNNKGETVVWAKVTKVDKSRRPTSM